MPDQGNGATFVLATSAFTLNILEIGDGTRSREMLSINHLGSTGALKKLAAEQWDAGSFTVRGFFNPNEQPPFDGAPETGTITYPIPSGGSTGATEAGTCQVTDFTRGKIVANEMMECSFTVTWTGATGPTFTDST